MTHKERRGWIVKGLVPLLLQLLSQREVQERAKKMKWWSEGVSGRMVELVLPLPLLLYHGEMEERGLQEWRMGQFVVGLAEWLNRVFLLVNINKINWLIFIN